MNAPGPAAQKTEVIRPPATRVGVLGWARANLFNGWFNSLLTLATLYVLVRVGPPLVRWALIDSLWASSPEACRGAEGACWSLVPANLRFIVFGFYPHAEQWRPLTAMILLVALLLYSRNRAHWSRRLAWLWAVGIVVMGVLVCVVQQRENDQVDQQTQ